MEVEGFLTNVHLLVDSHFGVCTMSVVSLNLLFVPISTALFL